MEERLHKHRIGVTCALLLVTLVVAQNVFGAGVQRGAAVSNINGTVTVKISRVDTTKAFLIFSTRHNSNRPVIEVRGRIATDTTLEFTRVTDEGTPVPVNIQWYVAEFFSGLKVQRGVLSQSDSVLNVRISPVASLNQAFVTWSKTAAASDGAWDGNDPILGELTKVDTLQFRCATYASVQNIISWQVIEFTNAANVNVQKGTIKTMREDSLSVTGTLSPAVDTNSTFVLAGYRIVTRNNSLGSRMLRAQLTGPATITIDRSRISATTDTITEVGWQAIELKDGSAVQRGSQNFPVGVATQTITLSSPIDTTRSIAFASVQAATAQSAGRTPFNAGDSVGIASATFALSPTQLTLTRGNTSAVADIGWFVVQFSTASLPIQLGSFSAQPGPATFAVTLTWTTLTETNNYGFAVQRKRSAESDFTALPNSFIPGHGTTLRPQHYAFVDKDVSPGQWLYRMKQVDLDGTAHYTDAVSVDVLTDVKERGIPARFGLEQNYPNPFNPSTVVSYQLAVVSDVKLVVYDLLGREVAVLVNERKAPGSYSVDFDASGLSGGVYFYRIQADNFVVTKKLLLLR